MFPNPVAALAEMAASADRRMIWIAERGKGSDSGEHSLNTLGGAFTVPVLDLVRGREHPRRIEHEREDTMDGSFNTPQTAEGKLREQDDSSLESTI